MTEALSGFTLEELFTDQVKERDGVWVDFFGGSKLKLASTDSPIYKARLAKLAKQYKLQLDADNDDSYDLVQEITAQAMADTIILDWKGISMGGQENAPYTTKLGKTALLRSSKFKTFVEEASADHLNFKGTQAVIDTAKK